MTERTVGKHPALGAPYGRAAATIANLGRGRRAKGYLVTAATPLEMQHAIMLGRLVSREGGVAVYAYKDQLYLLSDHDLAEAGI